MDRFQYLLILAACVLVTLPLEVAFAARVYRRPRRLLAALMAPFAVFYVWDAVAIERGHWRYATQYVTGWDLPFRVPVEEGLFFIVVPVCAILTIETARNVLSGAWRRRGIGER